MRHLFFTRITISILTLTMTAALHVMPAAAATHTDTVKSGWKSKVMLPSAGISYALSARKTSLRDVENKLVRTGKMDKIKSATVVQADAAASGVNTTDSTTAAATAGTEASASDQGSAGTGAEVTGTATVASTSDSAVAIAAAEEYQDEVNAIVDTTLTPVQERERAVIQRAQLQKQADVVDTEEISEREAIAASVTAPTVTDADLNKPIVRSGENPDVGAVTEAETEPVVAATPAAPEADASGAEDTEAASDEDAEDADAASEAEDSASSDLVVSNVTTNDYINIRKEPGTDGEIVGKLYSGSVGTILDETSDGWVHIQSGSVTGYVKKDYVATGATAQQMADEVRQDQAVVTTTTLRVRAAASVDSDVISLIGQGQKLDIIAEEGNFYKVSTDDGDGYISKDFADVETIYPDAVSIAEEEAAAAAEKAKQAAQSSGGSSGASSSQSASGSSKGQQVVNYAMQFIGNPYVWGGSSLTNGTDCSGFTMAVYAHFGVSLPHYDGAQRSVGTAVSSLSEAQPGDLICYYGHVGIYMGNGQIVHASNPATGITTGSATYRQIAAIRRIFN